jgi:hypothetical protein
MTTTTTDAEKRYEAYLDLRKESAWYWFNRNGGQFGLMPNPSYQWLDGQWKLGRYMDPAACQVYMRSAQRQFNWFVTGLITMGVCVALAAGIDFVFIFLAIPMYIAMYKWKQRSCNQLYNMYAEIQEECVRTGEPVWVRYDQGRLNDLARDPSEIWP